MLPLSGNGKRWGSMAWVESNWFSLLSSLAARGSKDLGEKQRGTSVVGLVLGGKGDERASSCRTLFIKGNQMNNRGREEQGRKASVGEI